MKRNREWAAALDRRLAGLALVVLALVGAIVVGSRNDKVVTGGAVPAPLAKAPTVGDCVVDPVPDWQQPPEMPPAGRCGQRKYGELVAVMPGTLTKYLATDDDIGEDPNTPEGTCQRAGQTFVGLSWPDPKAGADPPTWYPSTGIGWQVVQPDELARKFGADWTACVARVFSSGADPSPAYSGTLARVGTTFDYPPEAAICWSKSPPGEWPPVSCRTSHAVEEFGAVWDLDPTATSASWLQASCIELVSRMTGMADPTAGGSLLVRVAQGSSYPSADDPDAILASYSCFVQAARGKQLTGPLLNLDDGPIPIR